MAHYEIEVVKMNMQNFARNSELAKLEQKFKDVASLKMVKDMQKELHDFVLKEDFNIINSEMKFMKKDFD